MRTLAPMNERSIPMTWLYSALLTATTAIAAHGASWDVEGAIGLSLFSPNVENIPRGSSDTAVDGLGEVAVGVRVSDRVRVHGTLGYAFASESRWSSESAGGEADVPTPSLASFFLGVETPLRLGRIVPFAGIGSGVVRFGEIDEEIRFEWSSHTETNRFVVPGRTDAALFFDVGLTAPQGPVSAVIRYRLLSVFSGDQVNTIDRVTLAARIAL